MDTTLDGVPVDERADPVAMMAARLARRGIDPAAVAQVPTLADPRGDIMSREEAAEFFTDHALRALGHYADGEFDFDRLPEINKHVAVWVDGLQPDTRTEVWQPLLLLRGVVGCGKTSQLFCMLRRQVLRMAGAGRRYRWYFITHRNLAAAIQPNSGRDPDRLMHNLMTADLVVLDDLGDFNTQDWGKAADATSRLINHRAHHRLPLACTTNSPFSRGRAVREQEEQLGTRIAVLADALDDRAIGRLKGGWVIDMPQTDYRAAQGRQFGPDQ